MVLIIDLLTQQNQSDKREFSGLISSIKQSIEEVRGEDRDAHAKMREEIKDLKDNISPMVSFMSNMTFMGKVSIYVGAFIVGFVSLIATVKGLFK